MDNQSQLDSKEHYRKAIIELINRIDNLSVLEWLYKFILDGVTHRW